jgi:hypothetical protein
MDKETNVEELIKRLPTGYEQASTDTKALLRKREIKSPVDLIRLVLIYLTGGYSQLEMSVIARQLGIAKISDTAFLKRFAKCKDWLSWIVSQIVPTPIIEYTSLSKFSQYQIVALDASDVTEKGRSGRTFRLHYAIDLLKMCSISYKITSQKIGETLLNFDIKKNWLILADRIYGTLTGIESCLKAEANFVLRLKYNAFKLYDEHGAEIRILDKLKYVTCDTATGIDVFVKLPTLGLTKLRLCATKIPNDKLDEVMRRNKRRYSKKQLLTSSGAMIMSGYVVVITSLPSSILAEDIVSLYRYRWQVEIYFKRLKSILDFGNVPLHREDSIHTWLTGKLLISLLIEQMISGVSFSPGDGERSEYMAGDSDYFQDAPLKPVAFEQAFDDI